MKRLYILLLLLLLLSNNYGQRAYTPKYSDPLLDKYRWRHCEELSGKNFHCFCEGQNNVMWFGIQRGVVSYDGYTWKEYLIPPEISTIGDINAMVYYNDTLFVAGDGIQTLVNGKWSNVKHELNPENLFDDMFVEGRLHFHSLMVVDSILVGATQYGIYIKKNGQNHFYTNEIVKQRQENLLIDLKFHAINCYGDGVQYYFSNILHYENNIFYGFFSGSDNMKHHFKFKLTNNESNPLELINEKRETDINTGGPIASLRRPNGEIWLVSEAYDRGLNILRNNKWEFFSFRKNLNDSEVSFHIINLSDNSVLITSMGVIYRYFNDQWTKIIAPDIPFKSIHLHAKFTKNGDLWLGDEKGEVYLIDYDEKHWTTFENLNYQFTHSDNGLWFITKNNEAVYKKNKKWYFFDSDDGLPSDPQTLYLTKDGTIWCGGSHNQVAATAYLKDNKWIKQTHDSLSWSISYNAVIEGNDGDIWFGGAANPKGQDGQLGGYLKIQPNTNNLKVTPYYNRRPDFFSFAYAEKNTIYAATNIGLFSIKNNKLSEIKRTGIIYNRVIQTNSGGLWAATIGKGVKKFFDDQELSFTTNDGISSNVIFDIYPLNDSSVWAATNKGFSYYNGQYWINDIYPDEFIIGRESGKLTGHKESIWISKFPLRWTRRVYDMNKDLSELQNFFSVMYNRDLMPPETQITFYHEQIDASGNTNIEWTGIDFMRHTINEKLLYSHRINKKDWSIPNRKTNINLTGLKPGNYIFEVKTFDTDMNSDPTPATAYFTVRPLVWQETWFITMIIIFGGIVIMLLTNIITRNKKLGVLNQSLTQANTEIEDHRDSLNEQNKKLSHANATKNKFFSIIAHDLKNPFNSMMGFSKLLIKNFDKYDTTKQKTFIKHVHDELHNTFKLLENLLIWSRTQGGGDYHPSNENLYLITEETIELLHQSATVKSLTIKNEMPNNIVVYVDKNMLLTIIRNIVSNAIKFTPRGGNILINASLITPEDKNNYIQMLIKDNGIGIPSNMHPKLFSITESVTREGTENETGTGLGLILCKEFIEKHNGKIWVKSEIGKGTSFFFTLPHVEGD